MSWNTYLFQRDRHGHSFHPNPPGVGVQLAAREVSMPYSASNLADLRKNLQILTGMEELTTQKSEPS